jgi:hypothetical protein
MQIGARSTEVDLEVRLSLAVIKQASTLPKPGTVCRLTFASLSHMTGNSRVALRPTEQNKRVVSA